MITSVVGRTFLNAYNEKYGRKLSPKEFFDEIYWKLFYDSDKFLMSVTNSPFDQGYKQKRHLTQSGRLQDFDEYHRKATSGKSDGSIYLGAQASDDKEFASTSGLVSDVQIISTEEDIYLSWIGAGLGITVAGGFTILFDNPIITLKTFDGWATYRKFLDDPVNEKLLGNKVNSWNGQWLTYTFNPDRYREDFDFNELYNDGFFAVDPNGIKINTIPWSQLFFSLSQEFPKTDMMGYVYGFGQTNKTIGFIPFQLKSGTIIKEVYQQLVDLKSFGDFKVDKREFESLFGIHIKRACELGSIGLVALRPNNLDKNIKEGKTFTINKDEDIINYQAFKTWLVAMLSKNKEEIADYTMQVAKVIQSYRNGGKGMSRITLVDKNLFETKSKKEFLEHLTTIVGDAEDMHLEEIKQLKNEIHLMTNEEFVYFSTLLKFDFTYLQRKLK